MQETFMAMRFTMLKSFISLVMSLLLYYTELAQNSMFITKSMVHRLVFIYTENESIFMNMKKKTQMVFIKIKDNHCISDFSCLVCSISASRNMFLTATIIIAGYRVSIWFLFLLHDLKASKHEMTVLML